MSSVKCGIYRIHNILNGKSYWGSSKNVEKRFLEHESQLRNGKHHSRHLQFAWNKHGKDSFVFEFMWRADEDALQFEEQSVLNNIACEYNICPVAGSVAFRKHTDETKQKISEAKSGTGNHNFGKHFSDEHKAKISASNKGRKLTADQREAAAEQLRGVAKAKIGKGKGYHFHKQSGKYRARYAKNKKYYELGLFATEHEARAAYLAATEKEKSCH